MPTPHSDPRRRFTLRLVAAWATLALALVAAALWACDGRLIYSLDDPYIHLSVAESILAGGYGVNPGEYAAPSSSILYPLLLVPTELMGLGRAGPLIVNLLAALATVLVIGRFLAERVLPERALDSTARTIGSVLLGLACCVALNSWGLVMTGMEHSLHVLACVVVVWRLSAAATRDGRLDPTLIAATVALPLIRFEGLALALAVVGGMLYLRRFAAAALTLALVGAGLAAWVGFTASVGLPWLPSSVLTKSEFAARVLEQQGSGALVRTIGANLKASLTERPGTLLVLGAIVAALAGARATRKADGGSDVVCGVAAVCVALAHVTFGRYGWFSRYEVYAIGFVLLCLLRLARAGLQRSDARAAAAAALLLIGAPYVIDTLRTPWACRGTYDQQYQLHRFVVERWQRPIAANDLGWLTYQNPDYVLDLWGLGSEDARRMARREGLNATNIAGLVRERGIDLAIVYHRSLFDATPEGWTRVGLLRSKTVTGADNQVGLFATSDAVVAELRRLLVAFQGSLPWRVTLEVDPG
ncbi:MAG: hypothetical protein R3F49_12715 [Planctomycetota bacterium]